MERKLIMYYLTVGYPLGAEIIEDRMVSQVSFQQDRPSDSVGIPNLV